MSLTIYWILVAVMLIGVVGAVVPGIPGPSLILAAIVVWGFLTSFAGITWPIVVVVLVLILSAAVEVLGSYWGAKRFGGSHWSQIGAIVGVFVGFLGFLPALPVGGPLIGILVGPFVGAFVGEFLYRRDAEWGDRIGISLKASVGTVLGTLLGNVLEAVLALVAVVIFVATTWPLVSGG